MTRTSAFSAILAFTAVAIAGVLLRPAVPIDETRYLDVAWEMWISGDWLVPTINFDIYTHKPPLLFWAINLVWILVGVSETAARLVGPGFAVLALLLTGRLARMLWPNDAGVGARAALALSGLQVFAFFGGVTMFDAALAAATVGGVLAVIRAVDTGKRQYWLGLGVAIAAGTLIKGPVILLHLLPIVVLSPFWIRGRGDVALRGVAAGTVIALSAGLCLVALWLVPAILSGGPDYRDAILWTQSAGRLSSSFAHAQPWWYYIALLPVLLLPWGLVPALWSAGFRAEWRDPGLRLCIVWSGAALALFSLISGKQIHYLLPELPAAALIVARLSPRQFSLLVPVTLHAAAALFGIVYVAGLVDLGRAETLAEPLPMVLAWAFLVIGLCLASLRVTGLAGGATLTLGAMLAFNLLVGATASRDVYDTHGIAGMIAPHEADGVAFYGQTYQAEFNFAARLTSPIANPPTAKRLASWSEAHPSGVIVARLDRPHPAWTEDAVVTFRNAHYGLWHVADAIHIELSS